MKGPRQITDAWRRKVIDAMKERGITQEELAPLVGASGRSTISKILDFGEAKQSGSSLVPKICEVLEIPLPLVAVDDPKTARVIELFEKAPEKLKDSILLILEVVVKDR